MWIRVKPRTGKMVPVGWKTPKKPGKHFLGWVYSTTLYIDIINQRLCRLETVIFFW